MKNTQRTREISKTVSESLGHYVYALVDPRNNEIFYVGKGSNNDRATQHLLRPLKPETAKKARIDEILTSGYIPRIEVLRHGLSSEQDAFEVEAAIIDAIGIENLTNLVRGHDIDRGRLTLDEAVRMYDSEPINLDGIDTPCILFFLTQTYSPTMTAEALYDATRQFWYRLPACARATHPDGSLRYPYALSVVHGVVVAAFRIDAWHPAGTTTSTRSTTNISNLKYRWEFTGNRLLAHPLLNKRLRHRGTHVRAPQVGYMLLPSCVTR